MTLGQNSLMKSYKNYCAAMVSNPSQLPRRIPRQTQFANVSISRYSMSSEATRTPTGPKSITMRHLQYEQVTTASSTQHQVNFCLDKACYLVSFTMSIGDTSQSAGLKQYLQTTREKSAPTRAVLQPRGPRHAAHPETVSRQDTTHRGRPIPH